MLGDFKLKEFKMLKSDYTRNLLRRKDVTLSCEDVVNFVTSLESAISYWGVVKWPEHKGDKFPGWFEDSDCFDARAGFAFVCGEPLLITVPEDKEEVQLTLQKVVKACEDTVAFPFKPSRYTSSSFSDYDDILVDEIVQRALFGQVYFG